MHLRSSHFERHFEQPPLENAVIIEAHVDMGILSILVCKQGLDSVSTHQYSFARIFCLYNILVDPLFVAGVNRSNSIFPTSLSRIRRHGYSSSLAVLEF